ncbi:MAG: VOC family protein [Gammaproteobacteria bacterium]|nr:VOC family protein [Gammaproteobacteria bacterium]MCF6261929.1 VOC family protein [Gammaproteobacteria bacterium]
MTLAIHHLGLTVASLSEAKHFFIDLLGWRITREDEGYPCLFVSNEHVMLTLWQAKTDSPAPFNRYFNIGLHHFAIQVISEKELTSLHTTLNNSAFEIEFSPEPLRGGPSSHFIVHGPSDIRIEFIYIPDIEE